MFDSSLPLNTTVYMPVCYICNARFLSPHNIAGRTICKTCIKLPPQAFRAKLIKASERAKERKAKD